MSSIIRDEEVGNDRIMLSLLESVERDGGQSQRHIASDLGIALGLVNAYLRRCVKKGLVKVSEAPARRYAYYLTPQGFAEKSRLTVDYLSYSLSFFRRARADCAETLGAAKATGLRRIVVAGISDLADIARLGALEHCIDIVAVVDCNATAATFCGLPVFAAFEHVPTSFDAVMVTDLRHAGQVYAAAAAFVGAERVLSPKLLGLRARRGAAE